MRLTQIKLAGFKSFVDPTTINVPGQLVGVVGPNGCGKSNIIDAVRWVLGELRASALRGDSMQDVIFNGSGERNPVARASVELHFDNSLGKAAGAWSQYAEIAVKRILQRDGESSYFINNTHVRRRDVQDIFLGTGLGPRAYAIIEQGMISRIIEAKPEDLRVFLEEAAGISKYKERRRETENRLADTRENLARVTDIRNELDVQLEKLETQAEVAGRFQELSREREFKQNLLTLLKRNDARQDAQKYLGEVERCGVDIESETAGLRSVERQIEEVRQEHQGAADSVNAVQGELYQTNSEVSGLESEIRFLTETRQRVQSQLTQVRSGLLIGEQRVLELREASATWGGRLEEIQASLDAVIQTRVAEADKLPRAEQAHRDSQDRLASQRALLGETESSLDLEQTHVLHAEKTLQSLEVRTQRLIAERELLVIPDHDELDALGQALDRGREEILRQESLLEQLEQAQTGIEAQREAAQAQQQELERELSAIEAKLATLQRIQRQSDENDKVDQWLGRHGLQSCPRLWQRLRVTSGWETAVESVLRDRLHSLELEDVTVLDRLLADPPPSRVMVHVPSDLSDTVSTETRVALSSFVQCTDHRLGLMIDQWLCGYFAIEGLPGHGEQFDLSPGAVMVNREGHQFSRYGVVFHAPDALDNGILARQREIDGLADEIAAKQAQIVSARVSLADVTSRLEEHLDALSTLRLAGTALKLRHHEFQLQQVRKSEEVERYSQRYSQITRELGEIASHESNERIGLSGALANVALMRSNLEGIRLQLTVAVDGFQESETELNRQRDTLHQAMREEQDAGFAEKECKTKIEEIAAALNAAVTQITRANQQVEALERELATLGDELLREKLQGALDVRTGCEKRLGHARANQDELAEQLRAAEVSRHQHEMRLEPLRERIADLRLKEQAARLVFEQHSAQLVATGVNEEALASSLKDWQKPATLQGEITRLSNAILEFGAINMAALDELGSNRERKQYLDSQSGDLSEALEILDSAIRRIDRETREILQVTFNTVNGHFGELFPALFGGGEARLEMSGDEVLDSGVLVIARPPGKKNSSIHLLSGGEKALTAIALVFAMFQLNPAPFCLLDEVDAPLDDANTERFCELVRKMAEKTQFLFISHNKLTMEMSSQLVGVTMQERGVSRVVAVDIDEALKLREPMAA